MRNHNILPYSASARELSKNLRKNMTYTEKLFWNVAKKSGLGVVVRRQVPVLDYVVDFYIKEIGLAIEIDGEIHNNNVLEDGIRQARIEKLGIRFIRFKNHEIKNDLSAVLNELTQEIRKLK